MLAALDRHLDRVVQRHVATARRIPFVLEDAPAWNHEQLRTFDERPHVISREVTKEREAAQVVVRWRRLGQLRGRRWLCRISRRAGRERVRELLVAVAQPGARDGADPAPER